MQLQTSQTDLIQMSELKYRISRVSSEHPRYPASNLLNNQEGWQSAINCDYPQAITIQFFVPIQTKKLHLLFHQYKIPHLIEVFVKLGPSSPYRRLGYVIPNDNTQSSFQQKQQKTLYFQFSVTHIMFILHNNYKNERNIFNQVALQDLNVFGQIINIKDLQGVDLTEVQSSEDDEVVESIEVSHNARTFQVANPQKKEEKLNVQTSKLFQPIYKKLQKEKQVAIESEDFEKAAQLKRVITKFNQYEDQINRLQREKQQALGRQDYDACHRIKTELNKKKQILEFQRQEVFKNQDQFHTQNSFLSIERNPTIIKEEYKQLSMSPVRMAQFKSPQPEQKFINNSSIQRYDEQVVPALLSKGNKHTQNLPLQTNQKRRDISLDINQSIIAEVPSQADNTSIKKDLNQLKGLNDVSNQGSNNQQKAYEIKPLQNKLRLRFEPYFGFIPQKIWELCQNKNWKAKQEALRLMKQKLHEISTKDQFMGTIELISRVIVSKQATISLEVIHLLNKLTDIKIKFSLPHLPFYVQDILNQLLNFLNDTNRQIKELAYITYLKLPEISFLGISITLRELIKHKNKVKNDPKLIITKIQLMSALLDRYSSHQLNHKDTVSWILSYLEDPNQKVRSQALQLLIALTSQIGNQKVLKIIETNKPQMLENVLHMINSSVQYSKIHNEQSKLSLQNSKLQQQFYGHQSVKPNKASNLINASNKEQKPIFVLQSSEKVYQMQQSKSSRNNQNANIDLSYSKQSIYEQSVQPSHMGGKAQQIKVYEDYPYQQQGKCSYCSQYYQDQREHYIASCKVLIFCDRCDGYIYIRQFTHHLLEECEYSHMFTPCKKCGIALDLQDSNQHVGRDICKNKKGVNWERCQFCSEDIFAEDKFWVKHAYECNNLPPRNPIDYSSQQLADDS